MGNPVKRRKEGRRDIECGEIDVGGEMSGAGIGPEKGAFEPWDVAELIASSTSDDIHASYRCRCVQMYSSRVISSY